MVSRRRRLARLRAMAFPTRLPATIPKRERGFPFGAAIRMASGWAYDLPSRRTRWKSDLLVNRYLRFIQFFGRAELRSPFGASASGENVRHLQFARIVYAFQLIFLT